MKTYRVGMTLTLIIIFSLFIHQGFAAEKEQMTMIKVATLQPMTGPAGPWSHAGMDAAVAWIDLFNKEGFRVNGRLYGFEGPIYDDMNTPEGGAAAVKRAIFEDKVKFIVGLWDWTFVSVAAITNPNKVILFARNGNEAVPGGAYNPRKMPYVVFANPSYERIIASIKALAVIFPNYKKIGIYDSTLGKGVGWNLGDKELAAAGVRFHHEWYPPNTRDFSPYITRFKEAGCDILFGAGDVMASMMITKQRWDMGLKYMKTGTAGGLLDPKMYINVCGYDAAQGFIAYTSRPEDYKKTKVNPQYIKMCQEAEKVASEKRGKPFRYNSWTDWGIAHMQILSQAMQKAGTVDDVDKIMAVIRGGTFDTNAGKFTMSGAKTYGSPIVFGTASALCQIEGDKEVYLGEIPWKPVP